MTAAMRWPNVAAAKRDAAAEAAVKGIRALRPLVEGRERFDRTEELRRCATGLAVCQEVAGLMVSAGAPVRLEEL